MGIEGNLVLLLLRVENNLCRSHCSSCTFCVRVKDEDPTLNGFPKIKQCNCSLYKFPFNCIKAFLKSSCNNIPGMFWSFVCSRMLLIDQMFCPIYLPLMKPVWSGLIRRARTFSGFLAIIFYAIL